MPPSVMTPSHHQPPACTARWHPAVSVVSPTAARRVLDEGTLIASPFHGLRRVSIKLQMSGVRSAKRVEDTWIAQAHRRRTLNGPFNVPQWSGLIAALDGPGKHVS